jgi:hypothetical protein
MTNTKKIARIGRRSNQLKLRRKKLSSECGGCPMVVSVLGIIGNLIVSLRYKIVILITRVRHKNSFDYVKK